MVKCDYDCGNEAKYKFKNNKWCCENHWNKCPSNRKIQKNLKIGNKLQKPKSIVTDNLCSFGCGKIAKYQFKTGSLCCSEYIVKCSAIIDQNKKKCVAKPIKITTNKLCTYNCGRVAQYKFKNGNLCCENNIKKCPAKKLSIEEIKKKYPLVYKIEEFKYDLNKELQVRCKNHKCSNSKERNGWFIPTYIQLYERIRQVEYGNGGSYFYCCQECKNECPIYGKMPITLINRDKEKAGIIKPRYYTYTEYNICRDEILKRANNICEYCGNKATNFHHIKPQKLEPFFSLDPDFGLACCEKCHYKYGHKDDCSTGKLAQTICK